MKKLGKLWNGNTGEEIKGIVTFNPPRRVIGHSRIVDALQINYLFNNSNCGSKLALLFWMYDYCNKQNFILKDDVPKCKLHRNTLVRVIKELIEDDQIKEAKFIDKRRSYLGYMINPRSFRKNMSGEKQIIMINDYEDENVVIFSESEKI